MKAWLVDEIAHDFELEDVWTFALGDRDADDIEDFLPAFWGVLSGLEDNVLGKIRARVGEAFGWDDHDFSLPIPGCSEKSVSERLREADRARSRAPVDAPSPVPSPVLKTVYVLEREALYEASNDTIHALLHVSVSGAEATLRVYVKTRGIASRLYMAAIWPARHFILYPAMIRRVEAEWVRRSSLAARRDRRPSSPSPLARREREGHVAS